MTLLIELAGPCFADGERVKWPKADPPETFFAAHPSDLELFSVQDAPDDRWKKIRIASFLPTGRRTADGALLYEFHERW